jgi:hypothetical protein
MKSNEVITALKVLDDFILKQRMGLYLFLRKKLPNIADADMRDYLDSLTDVEERMMNQVNNIRRTKNTADMYEPIEIAKSLKREKLRKMSLRKIMDDIF